MVRGLAKVPHRIYEACFRMDNIPLLRNVFLFVTRVESCIERGLTTLRCVRTVAHESARELRATVENSEGQKLRTYVSMPMSWLFLVGMYVCVERRGKMPVVSLYEDCTFFFFFYVILKFNMKIGQITCFYRDN